MPTKITSKIYKTRKKYVTPTHSPEQIDDDEEYMSSEEFDSDEILAKKSSRNNNVHCTVWCV